MNDKATARKMVLVSAFLLAAIAVYKHNTKADTSTFRALWGVGIVSLILSITADFAPTIAGPFAALTVLGSLASGGADSLLNKVLGKAAPATQTATIHAPTGAPASGTTGGHGQPGT